MDFLTQLRRTYIGELPERLNLLEADLLAVESVGDPVGEVYNAIFRNVHSMKGSGGTYGFFIITAICHKFEDYLTSACGEGTPHLKKEIIPNCLQFVDLLQEAAVIGMQGQDNFSALEQKLAALTDKFITNTRRTAMIVTNSKYIGGFCQRIAGELGVKVQLSDNSYNALLQLLSAPYDILITGAEMPLLTGRALVAAVKLSGRAGKSTHTILITANTEILQQGNRNTDPDYVLLKDADLGYHLEQSLRAILTADARKKMAG
ncbi:MAG: Hpt domain-containing protein [Pseudomonadota bacterium]